MFVFFCFKEAMTGKLHINDRAKIAVRYEVWGSVIAVQRWWWAEWGKNAILNPKTIKSCCHKLMSMRLVVDSKLMIENVPLDFLSHSMENVVIKQKGYWWCWCICWNLNKWKVMIVNWYENLPQRSFRWILYIAWCYNSIILRNRELLSDQPVNISFVTYIILVGVCMYQVYSLEWKWFTL